MKVGGKYSQIAGTAQARAPSGQGPAPPRRWEQRGGAAGGGAGGGGRGSRAGLTMQGLDAREEVGKGKPEYLQEATLKVLVLVQEDASNVDRVGQWRGTEQICHAEGGRSRGAFLALAAWLVAVLLITLTWTRQGGPWAWFWSQSGVPSQEHGCGRRGHDGGLLWCQCSGSGR